MFSDVQFDVCIVGAGLSGAVLAERIASLEGKKVLVIEKRNHIGGNCYDFIDSNGILMNKYGAHLFHTNDAEVWTYVQQFAKWKPWYHKVLGYVNGQYINIPVNISTVNQLLDTSISCELEMNKWLSENQQEYDTISNGEQMAKSRVGDRLYEYIFKNYTYKQWNKYPEDLDSSILSRIPIRTDFNELYFNDKFQALPDEGYTKFFEKLLENKNITVAINTDFFDVKERIKYDKLFFTGCIDEYYRDKIDKKLEYRSLEFVEERHEMNYYQPNSVVNYPQLDVSYTRIVEYKHFLHQQSLKTTIVKEYSKTTGEPYYPVINTQNKALYEEYANLSKEESNVQFVGRLANYSYINMDQAIKLALNVFKEYRKQLFTHKSILKINE